MTTVETSSLLIIVIALIAANIPWLSNRIFFVKQTQDGKKKAVWSWVEVIFLYLLTGLLGFGLENKINGEIYQQGWEFYTITLCLFVVFSLPGFLFKYNLKNHFSRT